MREKGTLRLPGSAIRLLSGFWYDCLKPKLNCLREKKKGQEEQKGNVDDRELASQRRVAIKIENTFKTGVQRLKEDPRISGIQRIQDSEEIKGNEEIKGLADTISADIGIPELK